MGNVELRRFVNQLSFEVRHANAIVSGVVGIHFDLPDRMLRVTVDEMIGNFMPRGASGAFQGCSGDGLPLGFLLKLDGIRGAERTRE